MNNSIALDLEPSYFIFVCSVRCTVAALFKDIILSLVYRKLRKFEKAKKNFISYALPTILIYLIYAHNSSSLAFIHCVGTPFCFIIFVLRATVTSDKLVQK